MSHYPTLGLLALALSASAAPAFAGTITLTGHDDDYHCAAGDPNACTQLSTLVSLARGGSSLPVLTFDAGSELTRDLARLGLSYVNVNPNLSGSVTAALFNNSVYSAFVVASDGTCGGCDNNSTGEAAIAAQKDAIDSFLNAGGGIVGLAGANSRNYYSFVPQTASSVGGAPSSGYSQTAAGAKYGIDAVNGDPTHNLFYNPDTHGESSAYEVAEVNRYGNGVILPPAATTLICFECTVTSTGELMGGGGTTTPEPSTLLLLGSGLLGAAGTLRKRLQSRH